MSFEQLVSYASLTVAALGVIASIVTTLYAKSLEKEKSRLKKVEALFSYRYKAVQEFNKIYQEIKLQDCSAMEDSRYLYLNDFLKELRVAVKDFIVAYSQILNDDIRDELSVLIRSIDEKNAKLSYIEDTDSIFGYSGFYGVG